MVECWGNNHCNRIYLLDSSHVEIRISSSADIIHIIRSNSEYQHSTCNVMGKNPDIGDREETTGDVRHIVALWWIPSRLLCASNRPCVYFGLLKLSSSARTANLDLGIPRAAGS